MKPFLLLLFLVSAFGVTMKQNFKLARSKKMQFLGKYAVGENNLGQVRMKGKVMKKFQDGDIEHFLDIAIFTDDVWP